MSATTDARGQLAALTSSVWQLATIAAAVESGVAGLLAEPRTAAAIAERSGAPLKVVSAMLDVLAAIGCVTASGDTFVARPDFAELLTSEGLISDLRSTMLQAGQLVQAAKQGSLGDGWAHTDPELLEAQGRLSAVALGKFFTQVQHLPGLKERFSTLLDVGCGVAQGAIRICQLQPALRVVGLEPAEAPLALARRNVAAAGLEDRIELRQILVQDLADRDVFDFAWLPQMFLPDAVFRAGLATVKQALRPGGWLLTIAPSTPGAELPAAMSRLRTTIGGGDVLYPPDAVKLLEAAGYQPVMMVPVPAGAAQPILARRPE